MEFLVGLRAGLVALAAGLLIAVAWRHRRPVGWAGLLVAAAGALGLWRAAGTCPGVALPPALTVGLVALVVAGVVASTISAGGFAAAVLALPGAYAIATRGGLVEVTWIRLLVCASIVFAGLLLADFDRRWRAWGLTPVLFAVTVVGVFYTVPDTEEAMVLLGVALPVALLGWPVPLASAGTAGSLAMTGLLAWTVAAGGWGRYSSIVGGVACLGLLVVEPVGRRVGRLLGRRTLLVPAHRPVWWAVPAVAGAHLVLVYLASRVAGLRATAADAALVAAGVAVVAVGAVVWLGHRRPRPERTRLSADATEERPS